MTLMLFSLTSAALTTLLSSATATQLSYRYSALLTLLSFTNAAQLSKRYSAILIMLSNRRPAPFLASFDTFKIRFAYSANAAQLC